MPRLWGRLITVALAALLVAGFLFQSNDTLSGWIGLGAGTIGLLVGWYALNHDVAREEKWVEDIRHAAFERVRIRGYWLWQGCREADRLASDVKDPDHPEWRRIGRFEGDDFSIIFVEAAAYQSRPRSTRRSTAPTTWRKWYLGISNPSEPIDSYAVFGEVTRHLAPGPVSLPVDEHVETWARDELNAPLTFAIMLRDNWTAVARSRR